MMGRREPWGSLDPSYRTFSFSTFPHINPEGCPSAWAGFPPIPVQAGVSFLNADCGLQIADLGWALLEA